MRFNIGDKVMLVDDRSSRLPLKCSDLGVKQPKKGVIYVVRGSWLCDKGKALICLVGWPDVYHPTGGWMMGFGAWRFRKIAELKAESRERYYREHPSAQPIEQ